MCSSQLFSDISPRIFSLMYCCCVSIIIVICICPPRALIWLINLFLFLKKKESYKPLCKRESDNLWCRGKLLISIKRAMNSSRIELLWLVWDQSWSKYYLRTQFQDGIDKPQKCRNVCYHPTHQQQSDFLILVLLWLYCSEHSVFIVIALL